MEHVSTFFKIENDIFYKVGEKRGIEKNRAKEKTLFVKNLLSQTDFTVTKIAWLTGVTEDFVISIK